MRKTSPALTRGTYRSVPTSDDRFFAFVREAPSERVLVVASFADQQASATLDLAALSITQAKATDRIFSPIAFGDVTPENAAAYPISLPAHAALWILLE